MTGAQLKQLREDLGEAIGRPLTVKDFAKLCGLPPESGGGTILEWEHGYGPIGPVAALLSLLSVASDRYPIDEEIIRARRRLLQGDDASRDHSPDRLAGSVTALDASRDGRHGSPRRITHRRGPPRGGRHPSAMYLLVSTSAISRALSSGNSTTA
jgi:transcriptional regulator with XRE-family HTH domain